ncbi:hypothetical protein GCM10010909_29280 [Acidocella aquatica]|uniref:DUF2889 domain-containing protein n=1 Tax=Acidocella aquatica TaxID=1922313 RepID=A0ABQ6AAD1_9PROT|nr:hypothetical protein [Acidocella aquatica]GLR68247.1 hypothetical protein GCM10010909_29280 [Acidocella aquatica]
MLPGYRRRILITPAPGIVSAELEDDYHRMVVTLEHDNDVVTKVVSEMKRSPWTLCPGAISKLAETFTGVGLAVFGSRGNKKQNCTHLFDLALFAAAHANEAASVAYDIFVSDPLEGARTATLSRNSKPVLDWKLRGEVFLAPADLAGQRLGELNDWIAGQHKVGAEAGRILRWAAIIAFGRSMDIPAGIPATSFPGGACYNFQPERAATSTRRTGADVDFSQPGAAPLADLTKWFEGSSGAA